MVELTFPEVYDLSHTFGCGQIFGFSTSDDGKTYSGTIRDYAIQVQQITPHVLNITSNKKEGLAALLKQFFRLGDPYLQIQQQIAVDQLMREIVDVTNGLHILKQDPFECTIAYMLSQCSNIPRITQNLRDISEIYGKKVIFQGNTYYTFPSLQELSNATEESLRALGIGYRAKYIYQLVQSFPKFLRSPSEKGEALNRQLKSIYGIGQKVADCIQLFGYGDLSYFPVDTWVRKFMLSHYFHGEKPSLAKIRARGIEMFGDVAGYAQEFIFHYARCYDNL